MAAIRSICLRGDWRKAWSECLRIALARSEDVRAGEQTDDDGPLRLRSLVNRALEVAAWRALAQFCRELGDTP